MTLVHLHLIIKKDIVYYQMTVMIHDKNYSTQNVEVKIKMSRLHVGRVFFFFFVFFSSTLSKVISFVWQFKKKGQNIFFFSFFLYSNIKKKKKTTFTVSSVIFRSIHI